MTNGVYHLISHFKACSYDDSTLTNFFTSHQILTKLFIPACKNCFCGKIWLNSLEKLFTFIQKLTENHIFSKEYAQNTNSTISIDAIFGYPES